MLLYSWESSGSPSSELACCWPESAPSSVDVVAGLITLHRNIGPVGCHLIQRSHGGALSPQHLTYIHTDADLPPVAVIDRSPIGTAHKIFFVVIALLGAAAWGIIALVRGEEVNAMWIVVAAICTYIIAYRFYARLIECQDRQAPRRSRHARRDWTTAPTTCRGPAGAVRPPFRRHRRRRTAGRAGARGPDGLSARHHVDHLRRGARGRRAGLPGAVDLHPPAAAESWARWPATRSAWSAASPR